MSVIVILEAEIKEGKIKELENLLRKYLPETRAYSGFIDIKIHQQKDKNTVIFYEEWKTIKDYESYLQMRTNEGVMKILGDTFIAPPSIRYFDTLSL